MPGRLTYTALCSLDGYIEDPDGDFMWAAPDAEIHGFINDLERDVGTMLLGRRMYETLVVWETMPTEGEPPELADYKAIWLAADKIVHSRTMTEAASARTRIEAEFDPEAVRALKASAERELSIGGPELAAAAFAADLIDEVALFVSPVIIGGGKPALPAGARIDLELIEERRFSGGVVYARYDVGRCTPWQT